MPRTARRWIVLSLGTVAFTLALPTTRIGAACAPLPSAGSAEGIRIMQTTEVIAIGTIDDAVPADAHAGFSFFLKVRGYYRGAGPARIEVGDYGDGDAPSSAVVAGSSLDASRTFIDKYAGQDAVIFAYEDDVPYADQLAVNGCTYTAYGDAAAADILPFVQREFGPPQPPALAGTGPGGIPALITAASIFLAAGGTMRLGARTKRMVRPARSR